MKKWTYEASLQKQQNAQLEELKIFTVPQKALFHYTSREVFWKIMDSETFLARHIMFSNDYEEFKIGNKKVMNAMQDLEQSEEIVETLSFMVCFCEEDDLLSQWRGYAKEGVALEFDFSKGLYGQEEGFSTYGCYTIMNSEEEEKKEKEAYLSTITHLEKGDKKDEKFMVGAIVSPYSVFYTESENSNGEEKKTLVEQWINKIPIDDYENRRPLAVKMIPYIKNGKFDEEKEYRLIFDMDLLVSETQRTILQQKYVYLDVDGVRKPNIRVRFGDVSECETKITKIYYANSNLKEIMKTLKQELAEESIKCEIINKPRKYKMEKNEVLISNSAYQEEICAKLRMLMTLMLPISEPKINVWCDGHLPIRRVVVGPSKDAELMKCSIEEYLKTKYWTKDIIVEISKIPLRT